MEFTSLANAGNIGASAIADILTNGTNAQTGIALGAPDATVCQDTGTDGVNTRIFIVTGVKNRDIKKELSDQVGKNFAMPVVYKVDTGTPQPIEAFICVRLENTCHSNGYDGTYTGGNTNSTEPTPKPSKCPGNDAYFSVTILDEGSQRRLEDAYNKSVSRLA
jgi:hypothetical protein